MVVGKRFVVVVVGKRSAVVVRKRPAVAVVERVVGQTGFVVAKKSLLNIDFVVADKVE